MIGDAWGGAWGDAWDEAWFGIEIIQSLTKIDNYDELARLRMLQQFKQNCAPELDKLLQIFIAEDQEIEDVLFQLLLERTVNNSAGVQLDIIGSIVGIDREGRTDSEYRSSILVQIGVNNTGGQEAAITALLNDLVSPTTIDIQETFPAGLDIAIDETGVSIGTIQLLRRAIAATVGLQFSQVSSGETPFAFSGSVFGDGFGNLVTPTDGGVFAFVITEA